MRRYFVPHAEPKRILCSDALSLLPPLHAGWNFPDEVVSLSVSIRVRVCRCREAMEYRMFGRSGLKVSALGYGCMTFGDPSNGNVRTRFVRCCVRLPGPGLSD